MGYHFDRLDEPVFMEGPKPMLNHFGTHHRLESCLMQYQYYLGWRVHLCLLTGIWVKLGKILVMRKVREIKLTHNELSNVDWLHNLCHFCAAFTSTCSLII